MKDEDRAVSITPARLELITEVGPPDCPMSAFPLIIFSILYVIIMCFQVSLPCLRPPNPPNGGLLIPGSFLSPFVDPPKWGAIPAPVFFLPPKWGEGGLKIIRILIFQNIPADDNQVLSFLPDSTLHNAEQ